ncbi:MAG: SigB/SigF/SigG family RNA polymerase sigma factor [Ruminococcus sp.]|nr:SigB/SigF/SigG family RNA polymerase sigma factor [Ruminococcus sp.]MCM1156103.1 SigB/SigF/SigG family RNA polymerase sigma factor [Roseburia sp.]
MEETAVLIERSQAGDKEAREKLIEENLGLVRHIVKRFLERGYDAEDLFQIGCIGLMKAIDKFDLRFDVKFSTYAVPMIQGEIKRFLRDDGMVKVSRTLKENGWKIRQAAEKLAHLHGRDATLQELSEETGLGREDIVLALDANVEVESIYKSVYQSDGNEIFLVDQVIGEAGGVGHSVLESAGGNDICEDTEKERLLNHMLLEQLLGSLEENERTLIYLRYFQDKTQVEVARKMGISQVQVSRMEKRILLHLREEVCL